MKRYCVSRELDTEVDYFVTKADNARYDAQEIGDYDLLDALEEKYKRLLDLQRDLSIDGKGVFTVSSKNYAIAIECRDLYRHRHDSGLFSHPLLDFDIAVSLTDR